jgi:hypothetical protein
MSSSRIGKLIVIGAAIWLTAGGCQPPDKPYGSETPLRMPGIRREVWAVAPAINLSGVKDVDPLLQADLVYGQLQEIDGLTVVPVNRVVEAYAGLRIENVNSAQQAAIVCDLLGCDGLVVPTVTAYDPYDPPKLGASLQLFRKRVRFGPSTRPSTTTLMQAVAMDDAANGSVRAALNAYAAGRNDPKSPLGPREYLVSMDRYCGFVYNALAKELLRQMSKPGRTVATADNGSEGI